MKEIFVLGGVAFNKLHLFQRKIDDIDLLGNYDDLIAYLEIGNPVKLYPIDKGKKLLVTYRNTLPVEAEVAWENTTAVNLMDLIRNDRNTKTTLYKEKFTLYYPSLNILYMLKMSHRYLKNSPHFLKTLQDIEMMRYFGAEIQSEHQDFYKSRMKETYNYGHPKLNKSKQDFFSNDGVNYVYNHDDIHQVVARMNKPAYEFYKPDVSEVNVSKELFFSVDEQIRLNGAIEEVEVLAIERSQVPNDFKIHPKKSFDISLQRVASSITSGYFREFVWENYYNIQKMYDPFYIEKFKDALKSGRIKKLEIA